MDTEEIIEFRGTSIIRTIHTSVEFIKEYVRIKGQKKHSYLGIALFNEIKGGH